MNIFELLKDKYVLPNKPKLLENFSGIGCQLMAFNRLGIEVESVGVSEIDKDAILSYAAIHNNLEQYMIEQHDYPTKKQMVDQLQKMNVGYDFKKHRHTITMSMNEDKVKRYYAANLLSKNRGDISKVKGFDLGEVDVFTYSFPCTDLSKAGKQKGLDGTRSGLVYEVLRILQECKLNGNLPKVLIMENVVDLVQAKFVREFQQIQLEIEQLGYSNYTETLNAKDYGVAQNRDRVFMVSILGDYYYEFPKPIKLEKRLKDYLETDVDPKYYLSDRMIKCFSDMTNRNGLVHRATYNFIAMPEATEKGFTEAYEGDGVYINRPHQKRGVVQDGMIQTLKTSCADVGVVENMRIRKLTPLEVWRLMGIDDEYFDKAYEVNSNAQLYRQAGNGIVIDVFAAILGMMKG